LLGIIYSRSKREGKRMTYAELAKKVAELHPTEDATMAAILAAHGVDWEAAYATAVIEYDELEDAVEVASEQVKELILEATPDNLQLAVSLALEAADWEEVFEVLDTIN